ncbi:chitin synthase I [Mactra antiquata]
MNYVTSKNHLGSFLEKEVIEGDETEAEYSIDHSGDDTESITRKSLKSWDRFQTSFKDKTVGSSANLKFWNWVFVVTKIITSFLLFWLILGTAVFYPSVGPTENQTLTEKPSIIRTYSVRFESIIGALGQLTAIGVVSYISFMMVTKHVWIAGKDRLQTANRLDLDHVTRSHTQFVMNRRDPDYYQFEAHIFFDDAFEMHDDNEYDFTVNEYVKLLMKSIEVSACSIHGLDTQIPEPVIVATPYGGRIVWTLPGQNRLVAHLKDKTFIRHGKKRWSQVMYMYYFLGYELFNKGYDARTLQKRGENTFLLGLDGDVDFKPQAVLHLVDRMRQNSGVGAACGRIHPIGNGALVWYQKFEYAIGHWLQKTTEDKFGCVLCSPGCFSLFRGSALMDENVIKTYAMTPSKPRHYVQHDQGEDRWLCTLLLKQGHRVAYCAAADAFTYAPESFSEFFNQRRRWTPSTMANILEVLQTGKELRLKMMRSRSLLLCIRLRPIFDRLDRIEQSVKSLNMNDSNYMSNLNDSTMPNTTHVIMSDRNGPKCPNKAPTLLSGTETKANQTFEDKQVPRDRMTNPYWMEEDSDMRMLERDEISSDEATFWRELMENYLKPIDSDKAKEQKIHAKLIELRNKVCLVFFLINSLFVIVVFSLQKLVADGETFSFQLPCADRDADHGTSNGQVEIISIALTTVFGIPLFVQFICMLMHRLSTLIRICATTEIFKMKLQVDLKLSTNPEEGDQRHSSAADLSYQEVYELVNELQRNQHKTSMPIASESNISDDDEAAEAMKKFSMGRLEMLAKHNRSNYHATLGENFRQNFIRLQDAVSDMNNYGNVIDNNDDKLNGEEQIQIKVQKSFTRMSSQSLHVIKRMANDPEMKMIITNKQVTLKQLQSKKRRTQFQYFTKKVLNQRFTSVSTVVDVIKVMKEIGKIDDEIDTLQEQPSPVSSIRSEMLETIVEDGEE